MNQCPYLNDEGHVAQRCPHCSLSATGQRHTPRTDAAAFDTGLRMAGEVFDEDLHVVVSVMVARQLERERNELEAEVIRYREQEAERDQRAVSVPSETELTEQAFEEIELWVAEYGHCRSVKEDTKAMAAFKRIKAAIRRLAAPSAKAPPDFDLRLYFGGCDKETLEDIAYRLSKDCDLLRRELDEAQGVIR